MRTLAFVQLLLVGSLSAQIPAVDWKAQEAELLRHYRALVQLDPTAVFFPFGLGNPDHVLTHRATRVSVERHPDWAWFCYEDAGYKHIPGMLAWRVSSLFRHKLWPTPAVVAVDPSRERKLRALACYVSQLPPLFQDWGLTDQLEAPVPEQYWRLQPPPPGWEAIVDR